MMKTIMLKSLLILPCISLLAACAQHSYQMNSSTLPVKPIAIDHSSPLNLDPQLLDFNYRVKGDYVDWSPIRVFDDGHKTYIEMPGKVDVSDLPVLYAEHYHQRQLINHRYVKPYFIVDGLMESALLVTGKGSSQRLVRIRHCQSLTE